MFNNKAYITTYMPSSKYDKMSHLQNHIRLRFDIGLHNSQNPFKLNKQYSPSEIATTQSPNSAHVCIIVHATHNPKPCFQTTMYS